MYLTIARKAIAGNHSERSALTFERYFRRKCCALGANLEAM